MSTTLQHCRVVPIPGTPGNNGTSGTVGAAGGNAWASLTAPFTMPGYFGGGSDTGTATLDDTDWLAIGEPIFVETLGTLLVVSILGNTVDLQNLADNAGSYPNNSIPGIVAPSTTRVTPTGFAGQNGAISGVAGGDLTGSYPNPTLKDTGTPATVGDSTHVARVTTDSAGRVTALTSVAIAFPAASGAAGGDLTGTYPNPTLAASGVSAGTYGTGKLVPSVTLDAKGRATAASNVVPRICLLGEGIGLSMAGGADIPITMASTKYRITSVVLETPSADISAGSVSILNGAGTVTVCANQLLTDLTATNRFFELAMDTGYKVILTNATALFRVGTPVAAQTVNVRVYGEDYA